MAKVIKCGELFCAIDGSVRKNAVVVVEDNRITAVQDAAEYVEKPEDEVLDLSAQFVMPGLIDTHVHLGFGGKP